jgi:hypothetical protein
LNGKKPNKEEQKWFNAILDYGCVVCQQNGIQTPAEIHHINGGSRHLETLPLCFFHHRQGGNTEEYVSRHPWMSEWEDRYGEERELLAKLQDKLGF